MLDSIVQALAMAITPASNPCYTVTILEQDKGCTVKYSPLPEGVHDGNVKGDSKK